MSQSYSNPKVGLFLRHGVDALMNTFMTEGRSCDVTDALFSSFRDHNSRLCSSRLRHILGLWITIILQIISAAEAFCLSTMGDIVLSRLFA